MATPVRPELPADSRGEEAFLALLRETSARICETAAAFMAGTEPEATHQLRVALRRHRSLLKLFQPHLSADFVLAQTEPARAIGQRLSGLRQLDVLSLETLPALAAEAREEAAAAASPAKKKAPEKRGAGFEALAKKLRGEASRKRAALRRGDLGVEVNLLLLELQKTLIEGGWRRPEAGERCASKGSSRASDLSRKAQRVAGPALDRALRKLRAYGDRMETLTIDERHEMRKKSKTLRYAVEFFGSLYPPETVKPYRKALKGMQKSFGALNDAADATMLAELEVEPSLRPAIKDAIARSEARIEQEIPAAAERWRALEETAIFWR